MRGNASIVTSYEVNGYTLYAEEITKPLGQNIPSDLIGHTMYKAPALATAAVLTTSARTLPKRQSMVLCEYYTANGNNLSRGEFVADVNSKPARLYFVRQNNIPKADTLLGGLVALSSNSANFTDKSTTIPKTENEDGRGEETNEVRFSLKDEINLLPAEDKEIVLEARQRAMYSTSIATMSEDRLSQAYDKYIPFHTNKFGFHYKLNCIIIVLLCQKERLF